MNRLKQKYTRLLGRILHFDIQVLNATETINYIKSNEKISVIRFGDGEFDLIRGKSIPYQDYVPALSHRMKKIILRGTNKNELVCLPDVFKDLNRYTKTCKSFFFDYFYQNRKILKEISKRNNIYGSTFISRPYIDLKDKSGSDEYFRLLKSIWKGKDILIVEGKFTRSGEGNDLFSEAKSIRRIICPAKNAYSKIAEIEKAINKYKDKRLVLLMLGPTAKVIVDDFKTDENQFIDLGHVDTEYEWFKMRATTKVKIAHKHTAEFNNDDNDVKLNRNKIFDEQIVEKV